MRAYRLSVDVHTARPTGEPGDLAGRVVVAVRAYTPAEARATLSRPNGLRLDDGRSVGLVEYTVAATVAVDSTRYRHVGLTPVLLSVNLQPIRRATG